MFNPDLHHKRPPKKSNFDDPRQVPSGPVLVEIDGVPSSFQDGEGALREDQRNPNVSGLERESCRADFQRWYSAQFRTTMMFMMFMMSMSSRHIRYPMSDVHEMYALHVNLGDGRVVLRWSARGRNLRFAKFAVCQV